MQGKTYSRICETLRIWIPGGPTLFLSIENFTCISVVNHNQKQKQFRSDEEVENVE